MTTTTCPCHPGGNSDAHARAATAKIAADYQEKTRLRAAARHARHVYPGPVGELVHRELETYAEVGHYFGRDALIPRLADEILKASTSPELRAEWGVKREDGHITSHADDEDGARRSAIFWDDEDRVVVRREVSSWVAQA